MRQLFTQGKHNRRNEVKCVEESVEYESALSDVDVWHPQGTIGALPYSLYAFVKCHIPQHLQSQVVDVVGYVVEHGIVWTLTCIVPGQSGQSIDGEISGDHVDTTVITVQTNTHQSHTLDQTHRNHSIETFHLKEKNGWSDSAEGKSYVDKATCKKCKSNLQNISATNEVYCFS